MCGIAVTWKGPRHCHDMLEKMKHRGLKGLVYMRVVETGQDGPFIGHVRLPIIDTNVYQDQPITNGILTMAFNGEIYNYQELYPNARNDTEALLELLTIHGPAGLDRVDGMYAIVYFDHRTKCIHILTDHLAKKPLYLNMRTYEIASEIKALNPTTELEPEFLHNVARFGYNPNNKTAFKDIIQIPSNCHMIMGLHRKTETITPYLNMSPLPDLPIGMAIVRAVKNRLVSDVPISFLLSGGLDSSIVVALARMLIKDKFTTFTIDNSVDREYADLMAKAVKSEHIPLSIEETKGEEAIYYNESPVDLGSVVPQYQLCKAVSKAGFRVVITGDGADELFGGYTRMSKYISPSADTQYHDIFYELPYYHCSRLDKMSMAHTLELRSPFLSRDVIRAALAVPYKDRIGKRVLKRAFQDIVPQEIIERKKEPLRIEEMHMDRESFKFKRISQFAELVEEGVYLWTNDSLGR